MSVPAEIPPEPGHGVLTGRPLLRNAGALAISRGLTLVSGLVITAWLGRTLGPENYGIIGFAAAVVAYFAFVVALGLETLGARDFARFPGRARAVAAHIFTLRLALAAIALTGLAVFIVAIDKPLLVQLVIAIHGGWVVAVAFNLDFVYQGRARMGLIAAREIAVSLLTLAGVVIVVRDPSHVVHAAAVIIGAMLLGALLVFARCRHDFAAPMLRFDARIWKLLVRAALPIAGVGLIVTVYRNLDTVMLGFLRPVADVGLYTAAFKFFTTGLAPTMILVAAFTPGLSSAWGRPDEVRRIMTDFVGTTAALTAPIAVAGIVFAPEFVTLLFGRAYLPATTTVQILMCAVWFGALHVAYAHPLLLWGRQRSALLPLACGTVLNGLLNFVLIPSFGIEGAAAAALVSETALVVWFALWQRSLGGSLALRPVVLHVAAAAVAGGFTRLATDMFLEAGAADRVLVSVSAGLPIFTLLYGVLVAPVWWRRLFPRRA